MGAAALGAQAVAPGRAAAAGAAAVEMGRAVGAGGRGLEGRGAARAARGVGMPVSWLARAGTP